MSPHGEIYLVGAKPLFHSLLKWEGGASQRLLLK